MQYLTDFADQDVVLPIAAIVLSILLALGWWRGAAAWGAVVAACFGATLLLKLALESCGPRPPHELIYSPSGHTMAGTVVYAGIAALLGLSLPASVAAAVPVATLIGWSRVRLGLHTVPEAMLGGVLGVAGVAALRLLAGPPPRQPRVRRQLRAAVPAAALLLAAVLHGRHSPAEAVIGRAARQHVGPILRCGAS